MGDEFERWFAEHPEWNHGALQTQALFVHIDMDAFFCSVQLAKDENATLRSLPVGIAAGRHSSDIASCNYVARSFGICAGMYVDAAKKLCPDLVILGYDLPSCEHVARTLYHIIFTSFPPSARMALEVYSIDEVVIATDTSDTELMESFCETVRSKLVEQTGCTASCGIAPNIMLARLATADAKPDGVAVIPADAVKAYVKALPFARIHGAGSSTLQKVARALAVKFPSEFCAPAPEAGDTDEFCCADVQRLSCADLQAALGRRAGENFYHLCRGRDSRLVYRTGDAAAASERLRSKARGCGGTAKGSGSSSSSVSCSMNYSVRPRSLEDVWSILHQLFADVSKKIEKIGLAMVSARITVLERHPLHSKTPQKFLGRGKCLEVHVPVKLDRLYLCTETEAVVDVAKRALAPLFVERRGGTDAERAQALGLSSLDDQTLWTVTLQELKDIVIVDVRGMTVQVTCVSPRTAEEQGEADRGAKREPRREAGQQLSLKDAFQRSRASHEVSSSSSLSSSSPATPLAAINALQPAPKRARNEAMGDSLFALSRQPWSVDWVARWEELCAKDCGSEDAALIKAFVRCGITKVSLCHEGLSVTEKQRLVRHFTIFGQKRLGCELEY